MFLYKKDGIVILVDDGAAQGFHFSVRTHIDHVVCLTTPSDFSSVATWYEHFDQVSDEEVIEILRKAKRKLSYLM